MTRKLSTFALIVAAAALLAVPASSRAESAAEFPPGVFSDGGQYQISDLVGKVVVLFFYEKDCPSCRKKIPDHNELVKQFQGRPVRFFAIAAGDTFAQAKAYGTGTKLAMPIFADPLSVMEQRYGEEISLSNIYAFRVIGPDGNVVSQSMDAGSIESALASAKLKYDPKEYHAKLRPAAEAFEWGNYAAGKKALKKYLKDKDTELAESAAKLQAAVKAEAEQWAKDAEAAADGEPVKAYDFYTKVVAALPDKDEVSEKAEEALKTLKVNKDVKSELSARKMYLKMYAAMEKAQPNQRADFAQFAASIAKKYPESPTGKKAAELKDQLAKELAKAS